jgi:hypothetical protein
MSDNGIEIIQTSNRQEWLAARRQDVTASQIAALLGPGVHPYCSPFRLWAEKTGRLVSDDDLDSAALKRGRRLEGLAAEMAIEQLPPDSKAERNIANTYYRKTAARIGATPDLIVHNKLRGKGVVQLKSVEPGIFAKTWLDAEPPLWIALQALTEAMLVEAQWAAVGVLRVGFGVDFDLIEIPLHVGAWAKLQSAAADFWRAVDEGRPLAPDYRVDGAVIAAVHSGSNGSTVDLSRDNELVSGVIERDAYKNQAKLIEAEVDRLDALIRHKAGEHETVLAGDYRVTLKTENVKAYTVAARTRRPIRVRRVHGAEAPKAEILAVTK